MRYLLGKIALYFTKLYFDKVIIQQSLDFVNGFLKKIDLFLKISEKDKSRIGIYPFNSRNSAAYARGTYLT